VEEAFKTLRSNVEFCGSDVRVISITSCTPNEGKSSVAMGAARAFAEAGNRTVVVDADMRKSVLVGRYKTGAVRYGLSHYLAGRCGCEEAVCQTNVENLYMIFAGPAPPNPSELLGSGRFAAGLDRLKKEYDYIIVDTPPLGSVIDAAVAAKNCDGTILVVENNAVSYRFVQKVKEQLEKSGSRILGVALNKVEMGSRGYYGQYGRYYGRYYGKYYGRYYGRYGEDSAAPSEFTGKGSRGREQPVKALKTKGQPVKAPKRKEEFSAVSEKREEEAKSAKGKEMIGKECRGKRRIDSKEDGGGEAPEGMDIEYLENLP